MSELLLIIPSGWTQLDWQYITNNISGMTYPEVMGSLASGIIANLEEALKGAGIIAPEVSLIEAKLIDDTYFIVRLG